MRETLTAYLLISPQMLGFLVVVLIPLITVLVLSFTDSNLLAPDARSVGLDNYQTMVSEDPAFWRSVVTTGIFSAGLVVINVVMSLFLALVLHRKLRGAQLFLALAFLPVVTSQAAWAVVWRFLLQGEGGTVNSLLSVFSISGPNWLFEAKPALAAVTVVAALKTVGLKAVIFLAALRSIPKEAVEAARLDGASEWQVQRRVILPLLAPTTLVVVIITLIGSFQVFDYIMLMTNGGPSHATTVLAFAIYQQGFELMRTGYASALAVVLFVITLGLVAVQWWARKKWVHSE
ncbi:carbohydrate ABC transporter permease [Micromonospora avicenniae]|uniref:Carbohydrate ABC transporter membrane protein 1, CUT1 family n=1 Tax=Micromonospora avicenniae TaxID=1198245 RepID=A0A1N6ZNP3_9ACTN|nr:sugar ABC transporter permease [Micromonospora avicenniae]SIR28438.1 carbohydrate ABC transporter membrane protein 1, CUT1 family [Micromonospora avicenniae]